MLNVKSVLDRYHIRTHVMNMGVQDISLWVRKSDDPILTAKKFVFDLFSMEIDITDEIYAGLLCKSIVKSLIELNCIVSNDDEMLKVIDEAELYAKKFCGDINNSYLWSKDSDIEPKKKQTKGNRAVELYTEHMIESLMSTSDFIDLLCSEFDCDKVQARSLLYNARKKIS